MSRKFRINWFVINIFLSVHLIIAVLFMERCLWVINLLALATLGIVGCDLFFIKLHMPLLKTFIGVFKNASWSSFYHLNLML